MQRKLLSKEDESKRGLIRNNNVKKKKSTELKALRVLTEHRTEVVTWQDR